MKRKRLGGLAVALALGLGVTSVVPAPVAAAAVEAGWSDEMSTGEVVQGDEWTQEIVTNFYSGEIQKVIYRNYDNAHTKNKLESKWVYTANDKRWRCYNSDESNAVPDTLDTGAYMVGLRYEYEFGEIPLRYYLRADYNDRTAGIPEGGYYLVWSDGMTGEDSYHYFMKEGDYDNDEGFPIEGLEVPSEYMSYEMLEIEIDGVNHTYVLNDSGVPLKNYWYWDIYDQAHYFDEYGDMVRYWNYIYDSYYWFGNDGVMKTYWQKVYGKYYWLAGDGAMRTCWQKVYGKYYWLGHSNDGAMKTGWQKIYGKYYWLGHANDGAMKTGWQKVYNKWYYLGGANDGAMKTGWQKIDGYDYYFGGANDGSLKTNIWVNGYYVDDSGRWTGQECYTYSNGEYLSEVSISHNQGEYSYLGFWHSYGESSSCEDFLFEWQNGKYEYTLQGGRSAAMFTVKFTPTAAGMRIQVTQQDGQGYSWIGGHTGNNNAKGQDWINAEYKKFNGKKGSGQ